MQVSTRQVTGLILAGGAGRRVGGRDKGLLPFRGKPLVHHVIQRLAPQVDEVMISCNRNTAEYARLGHRLLHDRRTDFQGPLAALEAAAGLVRTPYLAIVPCDNPFLPLDLVSRLLVALEEDHTLDISHAHDGQRPQFLFAVMRRDCLFDLGKHLDNGQRAVSLWMQQHKCHATLFSGGPDQFRNFNHLVALGAG
jgi:molybdopterin-guanine dinucleotide biosynthesis protein A